MGQCDGCKVVRKEAPVNDIVAVVQVEHSWSESMSKGSEFKLEGITNKALQQREDLHELL